MTDIQNKINTKRKFDDYVENTYIEDFQIKKTNVDRNNHILNKEHYETYKSLINLDDNNAVFLKYCQINDYYRVKEAIEKTIGVVKYQTGCSTEDALNSLIQCDGDCVSSIILLLNQQPWD